MKIYLLLDDGDIMGPTKILGAYADKADADAVASEDPEYFTVEEFDLVPSSREPKMTAKARGLSYVQFIDVGWTDDLLREQGYIE